jgi:fibrillarin-like rRNA methylase
MVSIVFPVAEDAERFDQYANNAADVAALAMQYGDWQQAEIFAETADRFAAAAERARLTGEKPNG